MADISGTYQRASVLEAARLLGISPTTVRRMVRAGSLQAERVLRPQGHTFVVLVPTDSQPAATSSQRVSTEARAEQPQADAMVSLIQTTIGTVLGPLVGQLDAQRQTIERQAETIAELREDRGRQSAELERARAEIGALTSSAASDTAQSTPRSPGTFLRAWARLDWLIVALVVAVVVAGAILAVRR
jgi:excisionase family DNA binding protein